MRNIRWWIFKKLSALGWWICPARDRAAMLAVMPDWKDAETQRKALDAYFKEPT